MKRAKYTQEFKEEAVRLVEKSDKSCNQIAHELGLRASTLYNWVKKSTSPIPTKTTTTQDLERENRRLRKELAILKEEREILKKATAFFAKQ